MEHDYIQAWLNTIQNGSKLRAYTMFTHNFCLENYLLHETFVNWKNLHALELARTNSPWRQAGSIKPQSKVDRVLNAMWGSLKMNFI